jgi:hypothetical protein
MGWLDWLRGTQASSKNAADCGCTSARKDYSRESSASDLCNSREVADGLRHGSSECGRAMAQHRWDEHSKKK